MTHLITRSCCNEASCVAVCPVNCIHPTPEEPEFSTAEMLYIDPETCIDCGQCLVECPVSAIVRDDEMTERDVPYLAINADYYRDHPVHTGHYMRRRREPARLASGLRVAIVGSGPSGFFVAERVLEYKNATVDMFDRLPTPYGLARAGVAPDHQDTKNVHRMFERIAEHRGFRYFLNVDVGQDITHAELAEHYHAVVYATGASQDRKLGLVGEDLPNCVSAAAIVPWYNGSAGHVESPIDLSATDAVIIGNGNVALDVARILSLGPDALWRSDIPSDVVNALNAGNIERVTVLARRDVAHAAYSNPEFLALMQHGDFTLEVAPDDVGLGGPGALDPATQRAFDDQTLESTVAAKIRLAQETVRRPRAESARTISMRYLTAPVEIIGDESGCTGVRVQTRRYDDDGELQTHDEQVIPTGLVIKAAGYRGSALADMPFDDGTSTIPNFAGRVRGMHGAYVAGWIKRGPKGGIGRNRLCSQETAESLLADFTDAKLPVPRHSRDAVAKLLAERVTHVVDRTGWQRIDRAETSAGQLRGAPREKLVDLRDLLAVATSDDHTQNLLA